MLDATVPDVLQCPFYSARATVPTLGLAQLDYSTPRATVPALAIVTRPNTVQLGPLKAGMLHTPPFRTRRPRRGI